MYQVQTNQEKINKETEIFIHFAFFLTHEIVVNKLIEYILNFNRIKLHLTIHSKLLFFKCISFQCFRLIQNVCLSRI